MMIVKPCKTWSETVTQGFKAWNIDANNEQDQPMWKKALRTAMKSLTRRNHNSKWISK